MRFSGLPIGGGRDGRAALEELVSWLAEAARAAFTQAREAHPGESFYCYALYTGAEMEYILPTCGSAEGLLEAARVYAGESGQVSEEIDALRWSPADSPYHLLGEHHFDRVGELLTARGDPWRRDDYDAEVEFRREACFRALARLDAEGFFGRGDERDQVVVTVLQGDQSDRSRLENARRLNPPGPVARLARDLAVQ